jgi:predicted nuclease with RNAse H fold
VPACLGVDLAGLPNNPTGIAVLRAGRLMLLGSVGTDDEIVALARALGPSTTVAINAPLSLPRGRCCLDDACRCRHDPGTRSRAVERQLARERVPTLATALIKVLARRGIGLGARLRIAGFRVLETYPYATLRMLGLPCGGKRTRAGRHRIGEALAAVVPGLAHPDATEHELDAVVCALTADLWLRGRCRLVGDAEEGQMVVPAGGPMVPAGEPSGLYVVGHAVRQPARRAAERPAPYGPDPAQ